MSEARTIARPYAVAAWRHAASRDKQQAWATMLEFMAAVVRDDVMSATVCDPRVAVDTLSALMLQICEGYLDDAAQAFVRLLVDNGKLGLTPEIAALYAELQAEADSMIQATLTSAYALDADTQRAITDAMRTYLGCDVSLTTELDKNLLGGVVIRAGDRVIDASVRGQMKALAAELRI